MTVIEGKSHDPLTATYQTLEIAMLNDTLKEYGVDDVTLRRKICETYFFKSGYFLDSCYFCELGQSFRPGIYFSQLDDANQEIGTIFLPNPKQGTSFHEYAHGAASWLFDSHQESASEIETGDINATEG